MKNIDSIKKRMEDLIFEIEYFFGNIKRNIRYFVKGVINVFSWIPFAYRDRDWDHHYLHLLVIEKLKRMEKYHRDHGITLTAKGTANEIAFAKKMLECYINDVAEDYYHDRHDRKWGEAEVTTKETDRPDLVELVFNRPNACTEDKKIAEREDFKRIFRASTILSNAYLKSAYRTIVEKSSGWWD